MKRFVFLVLAFCFLLSGRAQRTVIHDNSIHSLCLETKQGISRLPVLVLGGDDVLRVSFDDLTHEYRRFTYRIEHVGADFLTDEGLFDSEYMVSDDSELVIEDYESSINTSVLYNHYSFHLPNVGMRPLLSGNYRLIVKVDGEDGEQQMAFETFFCVVDPQVGILLSGTTNTDIDHNASHQQLEIEVQHGSMALRNPEKELQIVVMQNGRWDNAVEWPRPSASTGHSLKWNYCRELIFKAGNEYRKFEQISTRYSGMHVDNIRYFDPHYYITLQSDVPRKNYLYDEDQNGSFVFRADASGSPETEADYMWVLFQLEMPPLLDADIYVDGIWTTSQFLPKYKMTYNKDLGKYESLIFLKQGYYSYQYVYLQHGGKAVGLTEKIEGNYFQTENQYMVFVYYRKPGSRYDQLVGWRVASYRPH